MKLKNKETGEIGKLQVTEKHCAVAVGNGTASCGLEIYTSLAELNEEWEDVPEEPKKHYEILAMGAVMECKDTEDEIFRNQGQREIGNYFITREEAELAVEKLKAWKRLKDKGFRFIGLGKDRYGTEDIKYDIELPTDIKGLGIIEDLNTCFGGEE